VLSSGPQELNLKHTPAEVRAGSTGHQLDRGLLLTADVEEGTPAAPMQSGARVGIDFDPETAIALTN